jgi:hypothetical protein
MERLGSAVHFLAPARLDSLIINQLRLELGIKFSHRGHSVHGERFAEISVQQDRAVYVTSETSVSSGKKVFCFGSSKLDSAYKKRSPP